MTRTGYAPNTIKRLQIHLLEDMDAVHYNMYDFWTEKKAVIDRWQQDLAGKRLRPTHK